MESIDDSAVILSGGVMGAPTVGVEKLMCNKLQVAGDALSAALNISPEALLCREIGGGNGMELLFWAALTGLPAVDGCVRGRAFPELQMSTAAIYLGLKAMCPAIVADEKGNVVMVRGATSPKSVENLCRAATTTMGSSAAFVPAPLSGAAVKEITVPNCYSQAWRLGRTVLAARAAQQDPVQAVVAAENGRILFSGKIVDVTRKTAAGFVRGDLFLAEILANGAPGRECALHFQNEYLTCELDGEVVALVPDLISVLETETGRAIGTEELKYGLRVSVIAIPCSPLLCTPAALEVVGPSAFGLGLAFVPGQVGDYRPSRPAIDVAAAKL